MFYVKIVSYVQTIHICTGIADLHNSSLSGKSVPENLPTDVFHQPGGLLIPFFLFWISAQPEIGFLHILFPNQYAL